MNCGQFCPVGLIHEPVGSRIFVTRQSDCSLQGVTCTNCLNSSFLARDAYEMVPYFLSNQTWHTSIGGSYIGARNGRDE